EAQVETTKLDYATTEAQVLQQEMILKAALTRSGVDSLAIVDARIVPTDPVRVPEHESIEPLQDMVSEAMPHRPQLNQTLINLENSRLTMRGVKNAMLPTLNAYVNLPNHGLAGQINTVPLPPNCPAVTPGAACSPVSTPLTHSPGNLFVGGYGTFFGQLLS